MIQLIMETNKSPANALDKERDVVATLDAVLKDATDVLDPVFIVQGGLPRYIGVVNYITCTQLNRQYFIRDVVSVSAQIVEIHCHVDVLGTWKTAIRENTGILKRQANPELYNLLLNDGTIKQYQDPHVYTQTLPGTFGDETYVMLVAGI